jgi:hypothetical protein
MEARRQEPDCGELLVWIDAPPNKGLHLTSARWQVGRALAGEARCSPDKGSSGRGASRGERLGVDVATRAGAPGAAA